MEISGRLEEPFTQNELNGLCRKPPSIFTKLATEVSEDMWLFIFFRKKSEILIFTEPEVELVLFVFFYEKIALMSNISKMVINSLRFWTQTRSNRKSAMGLRLSP